MGKEEVDTDKIALEGLLSEARRLGDAIAERHAAAERFVAVAGAILGVGLTLGLFQRQPAVLAGLPFALIVVVNYMIQIYTDAGMHSGHRQAVEAKLEEEFGYPVMVGQSYVAVGYGRRRSVTWSLALTGLIWLATAVRGGFAVFNLMSPAWAGVVGLIVYIAALGLAMTVLILALLENSSAEEISKKRAMEAWSKAPIAKKEKS